MSRADRILQRKSLDRGKKRRAYQRGRVPRADAAAHLAAIEPIAPDGVAQPGARRKAS